MKFSIRPTPSAKTQLILLVIAAIASSSLTTARVDAGPIPEAEEAVSGAARFESLADRNIIRDAKGNYIHLSATPKEEPFLWAHLDLENDHIPGTSTARAYANVGLKPPVKPVIVAVLDSGVDIRHPDLAGMIWVNQKEAQGTPGVDDDKNGYVDDVNGWNFIGNKNGTNLDGTNLELTRELKRMRAKADRWGGYGRYFMLQSQRDYLAELEGKYAEKKSEADQGHGKYTELQKNYLAALDLLKKGGLTEETAQAVDNYVAKDAAEEAAKKLLLTQLKRDRDSKVIAEIVAYFDTILKYHLNLDFNASTVIGDNPNDLTEKGYGNPDVKGLGSDHGTHCAGIIGALRGNGIGMDGQSNYLRIMAIRAVPNGDERDKDIANGIRYAVDQGARVISMSFGKGYSPNKKIVDAAVAYARQKGVLLVHAAGNDSTNTDRAKNFPSAKLSSGLTVDNWIEVGASTAEPNENLPAEFSNYGKRRVDLFAPGKKIYSTTPDGTYASFNGTSMATPEVAGIAALILSQKPNLTPSELKRIITSTVTTFPKLEVLKPGTVIEEGVPPPTVPFSSLSATGGVVNAYRALRSL